ncbi:hypothetical protein H8N03_02960 [Ramlibacter sp. USB13]|uniref:Uncharacterized protein n=1 Tax=Ramlibacter cellulosilyticus TaxID=2764187 RepID=A0A923SDF5_9BURK|nr:hypothetical protein [Ramlibacter cellulosilyticus]MBC5781887.1 hypothetical protein [Ramlibacter cellulosilyticus]
MSDENLPLLDAPALRALAQAHDGPGCPACAAIRAPGWEALPGGFDASRLRKAGTLRDPRVDDPTLEEWHPQGTRSWSPEAPVAPAFFPYNRCDAWQCAACGRPFLRYTEYGGYYVEERVRELHAALVVDAPLP